MNSKGYTLVEALLTAMVLLATTLAALDIIKNQRRIQSQYQTLNNFLVVQNNILNLIASSSSFVQTLQAASNPGFSCFLKQDSLTAGDRTCTVGPQLLNLYNAKGTLIHDFQNPATGFTLQGFPCSSYSASGNPLCPFRLTLTWTPVCPGGACENPPIEILGRFNYNDGSTIGSFNFALWNFRVLRSGFFCPTQAGTGAMAPNGADVSIPIFGQVRANVGGKVNIAGYGGFVTPYLPCRNFTVNFNYQFGAANDLDGDTAEDTESQAQACLADPAGACEYAIRIRPTTASFEILYAGAVVATKPAHMVYTPTTNIGFKVTNGRVQACFSSICFFTFDQKLTHPFDVRFRPA
ncbi:MAG: type II secretion system protein, partial [Pseudobdellovibrionaceae bacterium]